MHTTPDTDDYQWPTCTNCQRNLRDDELNRYVCRICQDRAHGRLRQLAALFTDLNKPGALHKPQGGEHLAVAVSNTAPAPVNLTVLNLIAKGGVATRLQDIEDAWRAALGRRIGTWAGSPVQAVPTHLSFLVINLEKACEEYGSIADDLHEIGKVYAECEQALTPDPRPTRIGVGRCPVVVEAGRCGQPLTANARSGRVRCPGCGTEWRDFLGWAILRRNQDEAHREAVLPATRAA